MKGIRAKKIVILEGSTGIGKSKVLAKTALQLPSSTTIGISAPTLAVLYQLLEEFLTTAKELETQSPLDCHLHRQTQFLSTWRSLKRCFPHSRPERLEAAARAKRWIKQGGPAITETSKSLRKHTTAQWLVDDLVEIVPEISASSVGCDDLSKPCPGLDAYQEAKAGLDQAQVIFSTHTMLCLSALTARSRRPSLLPTLAPSLSTKRTS